MTQLEDPNIIRMYVAAKRDDIDDNLVDMPVTFAVKEKEPFDLDYMKALYRTIRDGTPGRALEKGVPTASRIERMNGTYTRQPHSSDVFGAGTDIAGKTARTFAVGVFVFLLLSLPIATAQAQPQGPQLPPAKAQEFLTLLNDPEVKAWLQDKSAAASRPSVPSVSEAISVWEAAVHSRFAGLAAAFARIPTEWANAREIVWGDVNAGRPGLVVVILALLVAVGFGLEALVRRILERVRRARGQGDVATTALSDDMICLFTFALASTVSFLIFDWPPLLRRIVLSLLVASIAFRAVRVLARWILASARAGSLQDPAIATAGEEAARRFWLRRTELTSGFFLFGWAVLSFMPSLGFPVDVTRLAAFVLGLGILGTAVETVWRRPDRPLSLSRSILLTLCLVALWVIWIGGLLGVLWVGIFALTLPTAVRGTGRIAQGLAGRTRTDSALGVMLNVLIVRGARAAVIVIAAAWLAYIWHVRAATFSDSGVGGRIITGLLNAIIMLLIADLVWQLSKGLIAFRLSADERLDGTPEEVARRARFRTLLPIFRNALAVFIAVVTALTILSGLGVQIVPLIASAGVLGLAIGFGSQTLVKDVLSGVFYMLDDAFRVGEYIQSGSYKGTVESFSLRSVRLRHHRGPVYIVPFGELGAVQNMSRDWAITKMTLGVTHDSDVELARRLVKKIGQELAADPEFAADTIQPLKMQGIDNFGDYAIVLRMKMMTRPGTVQYSMKRRAYVMIKKAFEENGIKIAVPTVHVESAGQEAAAAAGQEIVRRKQSEMAPVAAGS